MPISRLLICLLLVVTFVGCSLRYPLKTTVEWMSDKADIRTGCPVRYLGDETNGPVAGDAGAVLKVTKQPGRLCLRIGIRDPYAGCVQFGTRYSFHPASNGVPAFLEIKHLQLGADKLSTHERWMPPRKNPGANEQL